MTKEEKCEYLYKLYHWDLNSLLKHNENQIDMLFSACKDEFGNLREKIDE